MARRKTSTMHRHQLMIAEINNYPGETTQEKLAWREHFNYWRLACQFAEAFDDPAEASQWHRATKEQSLTPAACIEWREAGFTPEEASQWCVHHSPKFAAERRSAGYTHRKSYIQPQRTR